MPIALMEYPDGADWDMDTIDQINRDRLSGLRDAGNVYAIFVGEGERWTAMYVGQRKRKHLGQRMRQHLVTKGENTGSQLAQVKCAVAAGKRIGIAYVLIEPEQPEQLRHYVEESIIVGSDDGELPWDKYG